jgi:alkanesulfonate monooxygenase SsuD/methylene tetrahydromethanopterin reductase-like flavin-dependent oxidoreductase (luciferase family)
MEFGVVFASRIGDHDLVQLAESLGFAQAWFFDSQMIYSDVYATMALAADRTRRIRLGTGVAVPTTRMAPTIAHSIATVNQLAPGRVELGVGAGNTARLTMGLKPVALGRMLREIRVIRDLLDGKETILREEGEEHAIKLLHQHLGFVRLDPRIPITLSAFGPKALEATGREMDGHLTWGTSAAQIGEAREAIGAAARKAGRNPASIPTKVIWPTCVLHRGESSATARVLRSLESFIVNFLHVQAEWGDGLLRGSPKLAEVIERYKKHVETFPKATRHLTLHEGHLVYARPDERPFLIPELAETVALVGEPDDLIERIRALERAGASHFAFQVTDDPIRQMQDFAQLVMRRY